jgi:hypothetical protein
LNKEAKKQEAQITILRGLSLDTNASLSMALEKKKTSGVGEK